MQDFLDISEALKPDRSKHELSEEVLHYMSDTKELDRVRASMGQDIMEKSVPDDDGEADSS